MPQQIFSFLLALLIGAAPFAAVPASASPTLARLEIRITTTSSWTDVTLTPGRVVADRIVSVPPDVTLTSLPNGWALKAPGKARSVVIRAVFEERSRAARLRFTVRKGWIGGTDVEVRNTSRTPFVAATIRNRLPLASTGTKGPDGSSLSSIRTRQQIFGSAGPTFRRGDPRRLVLAAYYPWYGAQYGEPTLSDRPSQPRTTTAFNGVLSMTRQARDAGIDGFVVSWAGEQYWGARFDLALAAARMTGGVVAPYLEMLQAHPAGDTSGRASGPIVLEWLSDLLKRSEDPAFLKSDGVPVVFVFQLGALGRSAWQAVLAELAKRGQSVRLVGDADTSRYGAVQWGVHEYSPNAHAPTDLLAGNRRTAFDARLLSGGDAAAPHLYAATVSPGIDDTKLDRPEHQVTSRGAAGERYLATWKAALAADPDWILVTSWNEWFEGTAVEPSARYGDLALRQTAEMAAAFGS